MYSYQRSKRRYIHRAARIRTYYISKEQEEFWITLKLLPKGRSCNYVRQPANGLVLRFLWEAYRSL